MKTSMKLIASLAILVLAAIPSHAEPLKPRQRIEKPAKSHIDPRKHDPVRLDVKFVDDFQARIRNGSLKLPADAEPALVALVDTLSKAGAKWQRTHTVAEERLKEMRDNAQRNTAKVMPDLNSCFVLKLGKNQAPAPIIDALNALASVELAEPALMPPPPPVVPDFEPQQTYLNTAPDGINARYAWTLPGGTGADVRIVDIEYDWNENHADLNPVTLLGAAPVLPAGFDDNHGTAVMGILGSRNNGVGTTGIAHGSQLFFTAANTAAGYNPAGAITTAAAGMRAGDIILIEQQVDGPANVDMDNDGRQDDFVPLEWISGAYNAITVAVGNGIIVVEAAGNGSQNLDSPIFNVGHRPFLAQNDSGAIIVGAGAPPGDAAGVRSRLGFSTFGSTVDLQGWGAGVTTTGYGTLHSADGRNNWYRATFNGTSSASPIVAGACALLQGVHRAANAGAVLTPSAVRQILRATGTAQAAGTNPVTENIGPLPNLANALPYVASPNRWIDFNYLGSPILAEVGSFDQPYNTVPEGVPAVPAGGTLNIKAGNNPWTGTITKPMTLRTFGGTTRIGP